MNFLLSKDDPGMVVPVSNQLQIIRIVGTKDVSPGEGNSQMMRVRCAKQAPIPCCSGFNPTCPQLARDLHRHIFIQIKAQSHCQRASPSIPVPF